MAFWNRKRELRATSGQVQFDDQLLRAMISGTPASKEMALQLPAVSGGIDLIANIIAGTPLHLHRVKDGKICEVEDDPRVRLLNDETGDTLNANDFWHAMICDYYVGKGAYAYLHRARGKIVSLHYVDESKVSMNGQVSTDMDLVPVDSDTAVQKIVENGHIYILRGGERYDITGRRIE